MRNPMLRNGIGGLSRVVFVGLILTLTAARSGWRGDSALPPTPEVPQALLPGPWVGLELSASAGLFGKPAATQAQWQQRFERVDDALEIRVGSVKGSLIFEGGKGERGKATWLKENGSGTMDLTPWVGNGTQIKLWARVWSRGGQRAYCAMDTLYNGYRRQRWEFSDTAEYAIGR